LGFRQLTRRSTVLSQSLRRRVLEGATVRRIAQLLQVAHECLETIGIAAVGDQDTSGTGIQRDGVLLPWAAITFRSSNDRALTLATRH
jgi:hypothetical protein